MAFSLDSVDLNYAEEFISRDATNPGRPEYNFIETMWVMKGRITDSKTFTTILEEYLIENLGKLREALSVPSGDDKISAIAGIIHDADLYVDRNIKIDPTLEFASHSPEEAHKNALALHQELRDSASTCSGTASPDPEAVTPSP